LVRIGHLIEGGPCVRCSSQRFRELLGQPNRLKDDFVATVSHELRTPLTAIKGYNKILLRSSHKLGAEERHSMLVAADRQGDQLNRLIEDLLIVSRIESHDDRLTVAPVALDALARRVVEDLGARDQRHTLDVDFPSGVPFIDTDSGKVLQVLTNLVENAIKCTPENTKVSIRRAERSGSVAVSVEDQGPGIPPELHEKVFERFYQIDSSSTREVGGTGLGLYICRRLAEELGGSLVLERSDHRGSVFTPLLPTRETHDGPETPELKEAVGAAA
jgi:signal transduction histidine kinase